MKVAGGSGRNVFVLFSAPGASDSFHDLRLCLVLQPVLNIQVAFWADCPAGIGFTGRRMLVHKHD